MALSNTHQFGTPCQKFKKLPWRVCLVFRWISSCASKFRLIESFMSFITSSVFKRFFKNLTLTLLDIRGLWKPTYEVTNLGLQFLFQLFCFYFFLHILFQFLGLNWTKYGCLFWSDEPNFRALSTSPCKCCICCEYKSFLTSLVSTKCKSLI